MSPRAARRLPDPPRLGLEVALFGAVCLALVAVGATDLGVLFGLAVALNLTLMILWGQRGL